MTAFSHPVGASITKWRASSPASVFATSAIIVRCCGRGMKSGYDLKELYTTGLFDFWLPKREPLILKQRGTGAYFLIFEAKNQPDILSNDENISG